MTVTLSYHHGFLEDCSNDNLDDYVETEAGCTGVLTCEHDNEFHIVKSGVTGAGKDVYYEYDLPVNVSTTTHPLFRLRYKTTTSIQARVVLVFTVGTQEILPETTSTSWTIAKGSVTAAKTLDKIQFWANTNNGSVWYDFLTIYTGDFSLPNTGYGMNISPMLKQATVHMPTRATNIIQDLGSTNTVVTIGCNLDVGTWKRGSDVIQGQVFYDIVQNLFTCPWRWFDSGEGHQFKVTVKPDFHYTRIGESIIDLTLTEYSRGDLADWTAIERWGLS